MKFGSKISEEMRDETRKKIGEMKERQLILLGNLFFDGSC